VDGLLKFLNYNHQQQQQLITIFVWIYLFDLFSYKNRLFHSVDRKRRRIDNDDSIPLIKLVRLCSTCPQIPPSKQTKKKEEIISNPIGFIDSTQANDLLSCYL